jgi:hypothetical protein
MFYFCIICRWAIISVVYESGAIVALVAAPLNLIYLSVAQVYMTGWLPPA